MFLFPVLESGMFRVIYDRRKSDNGIPKYVINEAILLAVLYDWQAAEWTSSKRGLTGCRLSEYLTWDKPGLQWRDICREITKIIKGTLHHLARQKDEEDAWTADSPFLESRLYGSPAFGPDQCRALRMIGQVFYTGSYDAGRGLAGYSITEKGIELIDHQAVKGLADECWKGQTWEETSHRKR